MQQQRVEWRRAMRQRSYQLAADDRRQGRMNGEQLKRRLVTEAVATDAELERLRRLRAGMEARLDRYSGEQARLRSQRLLRDMEESTASAAPSKEQPPAPLQPEPPGGEEPELPDEEDLTDWEAALLAEFIARQREQDAEEAKAAGAAGRPHQLLIGGLSLEKFLRRCQSRRRMDGAIRRLADLVESWQPAAAAAPGDAAWRFRRRQRLLARPAPAAATAGRCLEPSAGEAAAAAAAAAAAPAEEAELGRIERDFRSLLQEARKARYLRGKNPEILERDRELSTEEVFRRT